MKSIFRTIFGKAVLATLALGGFLLLAGAPGASARDWDNCHRRVTYAEWRYHQAVERFGPYSRDARHWAYERRIAAERCRRY